MSDFVFDSKSELILQPLHPKLIQLARIAGAAGALEGLWFRVTDGYRTYHEEDLLWQKGRDAHGKVIPAGQPGHGIVTNTKGGFSNHNFAMAFDAYPFRQGSSGSLEMNDPTTPKFKAMVRILTATGLANGGAWHSIHDWPHFQLADVPVSPTQADRDAFTKGGLPAVWALYAQQ